MSDIKVGIQITADSQDAALLELLTKLKATQTELKQTGDSAEVAATKSKSFADAISDQAKNFAKWVAGLWLVREGYRALSEFITSSIESAKAQENADHGLADALRLTGQNVQKLLPELKAYADELQKTTGFGNENAQQIMEQLTRFGLYGETLKRTTALVIDATAAGKDQQGMTELLGRAYQGQTQAITRYGIVIAEGLTGQEKFNAALDGAAKLWGGKALEAAQTFEGRVKRLAAAWDDFKKSVGFAITQNETLGAVIEYVTGRLNDFYNTTANAEGRTRSLSLAISDLAIFAVNAAQFITNVALGLEFIVRTMVDGIEKLVAKAIEWNAKLVQIYTLGLDPVTKKLQEYAAALALTSTEDYEAMMARIEKINDGFDKMRARMQAARSEMKDSVLGPPGTPPKPPAGGAGSANVDAAKSALDLARSYQELKAAETEEAKAAFDSAEGKKAMAATARNVIAALTAQKQAEQAVLDVEKAQKVKEAKGDQAALLAIDQEYTNKKLLLDKKYQGELDKLDKAHLNRIDGIDDKITAEKKKNLDKQFQDYQRQADKIDADEKKRQQKIDHWNTVRISAERSMYNQLIGLAGQYGGKSVQQIAQIAQAALQLYDLWGTISSIFFAKKQIEELEGAITSQATAKATGVVNTTAAANEYAVNAAASVAAIPMVGWAMAPEVYAASLALGMSSVAAIAALPIAAAAKGGLFGGPTVTLLGEAGPEVVFPEKLTRFMLGMADAYDRASVTNHTVHNRQRGGDVYVTQHLLTGAHADYAFRELDRKLRTARRSNDRALASPRRVRVGSARRVN